MRRLALALTFCATPALAGDWASPAEVTLLPGWRMENGNHMAALDITLADGWKTYWRAPGDGGIPPAIDWAGSVNIAGVTFHWPVPEVMDQSGMRTIGYRYGVVIPLELTPAQSDAPIKVSADLLIGICKDICAPYETEFSATLPADPAPHDPRIQIALDQRADTTQEAGVISATCLTAPLSDGVRVKAWLDMPALGPDEVVVVETANPKIWVSEAMSHRDEEGLLVAEADLVPPDAKPFEVDSQTLRLTVLGNGRAVDINGCDPAD